MATPSVPVPKPRLSKQVDVCSDDMPTDLPKKQPPPIAPKVYKVIKFVGQPLPGMVRSTSFPDYIQPSKGVDFTAQADNVEDDVEYLTLQDTKQTLAESSPQEKPHTTRGVLLTQQTWHGDSQPFYQRSSSTPCQQDAEGNGDFMEWWYSEEPWKEVEIPDTKQNDAKTFTQKAENLKRALCVFDHFLSERGASLQGHIIELQEVANGIDKVHKGVKIAGITGGAAGAVGVAAAVGGVVLSPFTMGASLAVTAIGVGVAAAGGVTGASAAITNKVYTNMDRKKVETILKDHCTQIEEIERCVKLISTNIECLKKYDLSTLRGVNWKAVKVARMAHKVGDSVGAIGAVSKSSGLIQGFALGLDMYFNKEDSEQLKKGSETKFAKQIRKVAKQMQASLDELMKFKTMVGSEDM